MIIEYLHPYTRKGKRMGSDDAKYGSGEFVKIDKKNNIVLKNNLGDTWKISDHWIRWARIEYYNIKKQTGKL